MAAAAEQQEFGRYSLVRKLATGGMAQIWLARQAGIEGFNKLVVVKRILPHLSENEEFVQMFLDEARIAAQLNHPNIVQIHDLGKIGEEYFIAMEYIHGEDVRRVWKQADALLRPLPIPLAARIVIGACEGLQYAHAKANDQGRPLGIVHRDVSPQNILVTFEGGVKVVDFGIAKAADQATHTRSGVLKGKYSYMSPEQAQGQRIDHRSDVFALGVVLYELLTGTRLFKRANEILTLNAVIECRIEPPSLLRPEIPPELDAVSLKALGRRVEDRYQDCRALQLALEDVLVRRQLPSSSAHLSQFMKEIYRARLDEEIRAGELPPDDEPSQRSSKSVKIPGLRGSNASREDRSVKVKTPLPARREDDGAQTIALTVSGRGPMPTAERSGPGAREGSQAGSLSRRPRSLSDPRRAAEGSESTPALGGAGPVRGRLPAPVPPTPGASDDDLDDDAGRGTLIQDERTPTDAPELRPRRSWLGPVAAGFALLAALVGTGVLLRDRLPLLGAGAGVGTIRIETEPPGAAVEINGIAQEDATPATVTVVAGTPVRVRLLLAGHVPYEQTLGPLQASEQGRLAGVVLTASPPPQEQQQPSVPPRQGQEPGPVPPRPPPDRPEAPRPAKGRGTLRVDSDVPGVVHLGHERIGKTGEPIRVPAGRLKVTVTASFGPAQFTKPLTAEVPTDGSVTRQVDFQPGTIRFYVVPVPMGADIFFRNERVSTAPGRALSFPAGDHDFVVKNEELGFSERRSVLVKRGEEVKVTISVK